MSFLDRLFRPTVELPAELKHRIAVWRSISPCTLGTAPDLARFIIVDTETSGLDTRRAELLSIGAYVIDAAQLRAKPAVAAVLRGRTALSPDNVVIHGIGPQRHAQGLAPEIVLMDFLELARKDVLLAFHAGFDKAILERALRSQLGVQLSNPWIDLAALAPALFPEVQTLRGDFDSWLSHFGLRAQTRHSATADAWAGGELFLILLARARQLGISSIQELSARATAQTELTRGGGVGGP